MIITGLFAFLFLGASVSVLISSIRGDSKLSDLCSVVIKMIVSLIAIGICVNIIGATFGLIVGGIFKISVIVYLIKKAFNPKESTLMSILTTPTELAVSAWTAISSWFKTAA